jgi:hypothetical protein
VKTSQSGQQSVRKESCKPVTDFCWLNVGVYPARTDWPADIAKQGYGSCSPPCVAHTGWPESRYAAAYDSQEIRLPFLLPCDV